MIAKRIIVFCGLWIYPISLVAAYVLMDTYAELIESKLTIWGHLFVWRLALIPSALIFLRNVYDFVVRKKRRFTLKNQIIKDPTEYTAEKVRSMYPPVPEQYLTMTPEGFILGKHIFRYFRIPMQSDNILHGCIIGAPGSGKSAGPYLCTLQANFMHKNPPMTVFVIDIKPELATKSVELHENASVKVVNPTDRSSWGWDVYYQLNDDATDDDVLHVLDGISRALITSSNPKDAFFVNQAQTIFQGMCLYYYRKGLSFVDSVCKIKSNDLTSHIKEILKDKNGCPKTGKVYALLRKFADKTSDAFQDIELTLSEHLNIFLSNQAKWCLRDNPLKATPRDLNDDISVFLSLPETVLDEYRDLFRLITFQVLQEMEARSEDIKPIALILDEFARIGKLEKIKDSLATLRSRKVSIWLAFQDMSQLESVYSKEDARTILNLCEVTCILSCKDNATAKTISEWAGEYRETHTSISTAGKFGSGDSRENTSQQYHKVLQPADVMTLKQTKEVMLFIEGAYYRVKRLRYFEDPTLNRRFKQLIAINSGKGD